MYNKLENLIIIGVRSIITFRWINYWFLLISLHFLKKVKTVSINFVSQRVLLFKDKNEKSLLILI